jgi:ribosome-associated translation inhibitor RaiA
MATTQATRPAVRVETIGKVPARMAEMAGAKVDSALRYAPEPVLFARLTLTMAANPAVKQPAVATVNVDMNGRFVRAQAASESMRGAIDQVADRLRVRLGRAARNWAALRGTMPGNEPGEWRHQCVPADRPRYFLRPAADRSVICQASRASGRLTVADAVAELELLDYDFLLFTEISTGADSVVNRDGDGYLLVLAARRPISPAAGPGSVRVSDQPAPTLTAADAITRLESLGDQFTFYLDADSRRGNVVYHRYDGHYGLLTAS